MPICSHCGQDNPAADAKFCARCGVALGPQRPRKGMAIASLVIGILAIPTLGLFIVGGLVAVVLGVVALMQAKKQPEVYGGSGLAIGGIVAGAFSLVLIPIIGILAAVAIPSLTRAASSANEASVVGYLRTINSAEMTYAALNDGAYDTRECLVKPTDCGFGPDISPFLPPDGAAASKSGYRITFFPGPPVDRTTGPPYTSPSAISGYAALAEPERPNTTGTQAFCTDASGLIRSTPAPASAPVASATCPENWPAI